MYFLELQQIISWSGYQRERPRLADEAVGAMTVRTTNLTRAKGLWVVGGYLRAAVVFIGKSLVRGQ